MGAYGQKIPRFGARRKRQRNGTRPHPAAAVQRGCPSEPDEGADHGHSERHQSVQQKGQGRRAEALLGKYVPGAEALRTKLRKYDKAYKALSDENSALEAELQTAKDASKEKIADRLKYGKTEQELCELHALIDNMPPEIVAAYRRKTTGLQNER